MKHFITSPSLRLIPEYKYMHLLEKIFQSPQKLLYSPLLSPARKKRLLKLWRDERTRYILENFRDYDYLTDKEMDDLLRSMRTVKAIIAAQKTNRVEIRIIVKAKHNGKS